MSPRAWTPLTALTILVGAAHAIFLLSAPAFGIADSGAEGHGPTGTVTQSRAPEAPEPWLLRVDQASAAGGLEARERIATVGADPEPASPKPLDNGADSPHIAPEADATPGAGSSLDLYLDRHQVTEGPSPNAPVVIEYPGDAPTARAYKGRLRLFIDQQGVVKKVEGLPPLLPPPMLHAATTAFLSTRFTPGRLDGTEVKTKIEVEVSFDPGETPCLDDCP